MTMGGSGFLRDEVGGGRGRGEVVLRYGDGD